MSFTRLMGLLGGLALFLYGMQMMSTGLEAAAGNRMKGILEKLTSNRFLGVLVGALITAVIQSSSATTVMVVGFVNSGIMTLTQAVWIIMGANIGTTITGQLIALDAGAIAPLLAFVGVAIVVFIKNEKAKNAGQILAGLGVLFIGMDMMGNAMKPLAESPSFVNILTKFENPILGILTGTVFTAIIQSSSASVGILQALAKSGAIGLNSAAFILFGQNIGTCITALLASVGTNVNARRTTLIHIMFNVFGTVIFTIICLVTPFLNIITNISPYNVTSQIANLHTIFNIVTTILLLPIGSYLPKLATMLMKDNGKDDNEALDEMKTMYLIDFKHIDKEKLATSSLVCIESIKKEVTRMLELAKLNVSESLSIFANHNLKKYNVIEKREDYVDYLNREISKYITSVIYFEKSKAGSQVLNSMFSITSNIERLSDHAVNIAGYSKMIAEKQIVFSEAASLELKEMQETCEKLFELLEDIPEDYITWHKLVAFFEQKIDDMTIQFRNNMYDRIQKNICSDEGSILFSEMLTDFERIGDHALNIADEMVKISLAA